MIEVMMATAIIGIGVTAIFTAIRSGTQVNAAGRDLTQAAFLVQEIREWTLKLPFSDPDAADAANPPGPDGTDPQTFVDDLDDLMNVTFGPPNPPRDGNGVAIANLAGWSQHIQLDWKNPDSLQTTVASGASDVIRVTVTIARNGETILSSGWLVTRRLP